jgi:hypothetical protein
MTRHPVLRPGDTLRLGGAMHTVAGLDRATVLLADVTGAVIEVTTAGLDAPVSRSPFPRRASSPASRHAC